MGAKVAGKYLPFVKKLSQSQVIILDDFGLRNYTHDEANVLVDILEDHVIAEAIVSRLEHPSQKLIIGGGNYRGNLQNQLPSRKNLN